jgi:hypothetical protein
MGKRDDFLEMKNRLNLYENKNSRSIELGFYKKYL